MSGYAACNSFSPTSPCTWTAVAQQNDPCTCKNKGGIFSDIMKSKSLWLRWQALPCDVYQKEFEDEYSCRDGVVWKGKPDLLVFAFQPTWDAWCAVPYNALRFCFLEGLRVWTPWPCGFVPCFLSPFLMCSKTVRCQFGPGSNVFILYIMFAVRGSLGLTGWKPPKTPLVLAPVPFFSLLSVQNTRLARPHCSVNHTLTPAPDVPGLNSWWSHKIQHQETMDTKNVSNHIIQSSSHTPESITRNTTIRSASKSKRSKRMFGANFGC